MRPYNELHYELGEGRLSVYMSRSLFKLPRGQMLLARMLMSAKDKAGIKVKLKPCTFIEHSV